MKRLVFLLSVGLFTARSLSGDSFWPQWRGPNFDGSTEARNLPASFSKTENVVWSAEMPGPSAATPVVWGDRVFVSSVDSASRSVVALCVDRKSGKELWRQKVQDGDRQDDRSNYASPSPVTDGRHVWFFYGSTDLVCFDIEGHEVWRRNIQKDLGQFAFLWTFSSSPLLYDGRLYLQILQRDVPVNGKGRTDGPNESFLLAVDPKTGKDLWRVVRPSEARQESREAFSTPMPYTHKGKTELIIMGGDDLTGHDPATGKELWRWGTWNPRRETHWRLVPSPVAGAGVALACGPKGAPIFAVKTGLSGKLDDSAIAWKSAEREVSTDVSTPLFYRGRFYVLNSDRRKLFAIEPAGGKVIWSGDLPTQSKVESSPTAADGKIFALSQTGDVIAVAAGDEFKVLHSANFADEGDRELRSCIAIAQDQLFVRTGRRLYCLGGK
jgi:outer membrane protein assembly factor BamB